MAIQSQIFLVYLLSGFSFQPQSELLNSLISICHRTATIHNWRSGASLKCWSCYILLSLGKEVHQWWKLSIYIQVVAVADWGTNTIFYQAVYHSPFSSLSCLGVLLALIYAPLPFPIFWSGSVGFLVILSLACSRLFPPPISPFINCPKHWTEHEPDPRHKGAHPAHPYPLNERDRRGHSSSSKEASGQIVCSYSRSRTLNVAIDNKGIEWAESSCDCMTGEK